MIVIAVCGVICAADTWSDIVDFGHAKLKWFETFLDLPHGIPSQDTFERVFARLDPDSCLDIRTTCCDCEHVVVIEIYSG